MPPSRRPSRRAGAPGRNTARARAERGDGGNVRTLRREDRPRIVVRPEALEDFSESVNWLIQGDSGVGKTVFASFAPNAYFLSTEKGVVAAKRVGSPAQLLRAPDWEHVEASLDWADENLGAEHWLILDSATRMQILLRYHLLKRLHDENDERDIDVPERQDHQKWQNMYMRFIDRIIEAPYNAILTTTSMHKEDPEGDSLVLPQITGQDYGISNYVCSQMDIVSHYAVQRHRRDEPTMRRMLFETFPPYFAKDRFHVLPRWTEVEEDDFTAIQPMIERIMDLSPGERKAAKAAVARRRNNGREQQ